MQSKSLKWRNRAILLLLAMLECAPVLGQAVCTSEVNLLPKYGNWPKCQALINADKSFIAFIEIEHSGDRKKASVALASRGWQYFSQGNLDDAIRRFNQAWLLDGRNGVALWGMGAVESNRAKHSEAVALFTEAAQFVGKNHRFHKNTVR